MKYVVDAHPLIWFFSASPRLGQAALSAMSDRSNDFVVPITALAEACWVIEAGRTNIPSVSHLLVDLDADRRMVVVPLIRQVLDISLTLQRIGEIHDRQIVATAVDLQSQGEQVALLTKDVNITQSGYVPVIW